MLYHPESMDPVRREGFQKGQGGGFARHVISPGSLEGTSRFQMVSHITLDPGASIGEHRHEGDEEVYCILSGSGEYLEEGEWIAVRPGHITVALRGGTHALRNTGKEPLELLAVIAK